MFVASKLEGGGGGGAEAFVAGPLKKELLFCLGIFIFF